MNTTESRPFKRPRTESGDVEDDMVDVVLSSSSPSDTEQSTPLSNATTTADSSQLLYSLIESKQWYEVATIARAHSESIISMTSSSSSSMSLSSRNRERQSQQQQPSMLALCCRLGAPYECIKPIVDAAPHHLREVLDARGTPLHEAIVCEETSPRVIEYLLHIDEQIGGYPRAAVLQDVDGYTPLHLVIRRRFQSYVMGIDQASPMLEILRLLVQSCAEAIVIPDRGEYEEPPIVMALKASVYTPMLMPPSEEESSSLMESHIYRVVDCMLQHYPQAASRVFRGYRGHYTALHSAVFHGRSPDTIQLLLDAERRVPTSPQKACLLGNTQGELPLHFSAMRGEPPRTVRLLAEAAPEAITQRDASGLTPMHWLWIRFVSTLLTMEDGRGNTITLPLRRRQRRRSQNHQPQQQQQDEDEDELAFALLQQSDFDADLQLLRRVDPSVDFLQMRHISVEAQEESDALLWAERTATLLSSVKDRFLHSNNNASHEETEIHHIQLNRLEAVSMLFWTKVTSLLRILAQEEIPEGTLDGQCTTKTRLLKTAMVNECCPPLVARMVALLLPQELSQPDHKGRVALHYAAMRPWHAWAWPREDGTSDAASQRILHLESASLLRNAMSLSPPEAAQQMDHYGRLPLHYMISTCIQACCAGGRSACEDPLLEMVEILGYFVQLYPDSLHVLDPQTGLYPFLQASAEATEARAALTTKSSSSSSLASTTTSSSTTTIHEEFPLSIVYLLLREDPSHIIRVAGLREH